MQCQPYNPDRHDGAVVAQPTNNKKKKKTPKLAVHIKRGGFTRQGRMQDFSRGWGRIRHLRQKNLGGKFSAPPAPL